jgi:hypothetical protein
MLGGRYAVADAATGYWSQVCPSSWRPPAFGVRPPHCLRKKGTSERLQASQMPRAQFGVHGPSPGPLSPPTITQEMPVRLRSTGPSSGSTERKRTAVGTLRRAAWLWPSSLTAQESFFSGCVEAPSGTTCRGVVADIGLGPRDRPPSPWLGRRPRRMPGREGLTPGRAARPRAGVNPRPCHGHGSLPTNSHRPIPGRGQQVTVIASRPPGARLPGPVGHTCCPPARERS